MAIAPEPNRLSQALTLAVHELRTPASVVSGYVRMLLRDEAGAITGTQRTILDAVAGSCARMGALLAEMNALAHVEAGDAHVPRVPFDLTALIDELASRPLEGDEYRARLEARATGPVVVAGDRTRLAAALWALMHAALRERREPGVVVVECSMVADADRTWAIVTIGDEAITRTLVDPAREVSSFDEWRGGIGFGLPTGRRVIEAHGGALWSAPGDAPRAGFVLRLPVATPAPDDVRTVEAV